MGLYSLAIDDDARLTVQVLDTIMPLLNQNDSMAPRDLGIMEHQMVGRGAANVERRCGDGKPMSRIGANRDL